ncbi:suppressor of fused domain protein [Paenibacillus planticolens]|uniref:Suppressor of fused-like domain-containing protein n=1 Tax=Paenibacillus planticolens TaxID=2654976 RepID=A0ABX1ZQW5_9BACL|nr:suppressor of fused domain protein [Paenibacillus planticolens]NOV01174.1 hypothetical protein [Paenibacillus planticolens]
MIKANVEIFLEHIEEIFGTDYKISKFDAKDNGKPIYLFTYKDIPEKGMQTFITYGLSEGEHPEWLGGKPELILSLEASDPTWGEAIAYLASERRGIKRFSYGDFFTFEEPISVESKMSGFLVFSPSILDKDSIEIQTNGRSIFLTGMYPIYIEEVELIQEVGIKQFWFTPGFDLYKVDRINLALKENL